MPEELFTLLRLHPFPGNVRELQTLVFDAVSQHKGGILSLNVFKGHIKLHRSRENPALDATSDMAEVQSKQINFPEDLPTIKQATQQLVSEALKRAGGNQSIAAGILGITQQALSKRLKKNKDSPSS